MEHIVTKRFTQLTLSFVLGARRGEEEEEEENEEVGGKKRNLCSFHVVRACV